MPADEADTNIQHLQLSDVSDLAPLVQAGEISKADALLVQELPACPGNTMTKASGFHLPPCCLSQTIQRSKASEL